jgi:hypothetical protein
MAAGGARDEVASESGHPTRVSERATAQPMIAPMTAPISTPTAPAAQIHLARLPAVSPLEEGREFVNSHARILRNKQQLCIRVSDKGNKGARVNNKGGSA